MVQIADQIAALGKSQVEAALKITELGVNTAEKLADLQFKWNKLSYEDSVKALRQVASIKDATELATLASGVVQPAWEKGTAYAKSVYDVVSAAQSELGSLVEQQVADFNKNVVVTLDAAAKSAPAGSEGALSALKSALQSANTMYETVARATKQVTTVTEANLATLSGEVVASAKKKAAS